MGRFGSGSSCATVYTDRMSSLANGLPINSVAPVRRRVLISLAAGLLWGFLSYLLLRQRGYLASDFNWMWAAARYLLQGHNPYHNPAFVLGNPYPFSNPLPYPLPAVFYSIPFAPFTPYLAGALFFGVSVAILAFSVSGHGTKYLPIFFTSSMYMAASVAQWTPLIVAGAFLPAVIPILAIKPNIALAVYSWRPTLRAIPLTLLVVAIGFIVLPTWVGDWYGTLGQHFNPIPILVFPFGPILLLSVLAWRRPGGRLLLLMALMPQTPCFYDQLPLWLIPKTRQQGWILSIFSWISLVGWMQTHGDVSMGKAVSEAQPWIVVLMYYPAMGILMWQEYQSWRMRSGARRSSKVSGDLVAEPESVRRSAVLDAHNG